MLDLERVDRTPSKQDSTLRARIAKEFRENPRPSAVGGEPSERALKGPEQNALELEILRIDEGLSAFFGAAIPR